MKSFKFREVVSPAIDYLLLGEQADLAIVDEQTKQKYNIVKEALLDIVEDFGSVVAVSDKDLLEAAVELVASAKDEAKKFFFEHRQVMTEACKKKAKKRLKESDYQTLDEISQEIVNKTLLEQALFFLTVFPVLVENAIDVTEVDHDIKVRAAYTLIEDLTNIASEVKEPCCK